MNKSSRSRSFVLGIAIVALGILAFMVIYPAINIDPVFPKQPREMAAIITALQAYHGYYKSFPAGGTDEVLKVLKGENARRIYFIEPSEQILDDDWNTPYRLTIDEASIVIASAGPDRIWDTTDDIQMEKSIEQGSGGYVAPRRVAEPHR